MTRWQDDSMTGRHGDMTIAAKSFQMLHKKIAKVGKRWQKLLNTTY